MKIITSKKEVTIECVKLVSEIAVLPAIAVGKRSKCTYIQIAFLRRIVEIEINQL